MIQVLNSKSDMDYFSTHATFADQRSSFKQKTIQIVGITVPKYLSRGH